jgi:RNA polymerase sigma factor (sigma-70 family)
MPATLQHTSEIAASGRATSAEFEGTDDADLCRMVAEGRAAMEELIHRHRRMVFKIAHDHETPGIDPEELVQRGLLALQRAVIKWKPEGGAKLITYAYHAVRREVWQAAGNRLSAAQASGVGIGHEANMFDFIPAPERGGPSPEQIREQVAKLPAVLARVVRRRYGLDDGQPLGTQAIGCELGLTREQVNNALTQAFELLRPAFAD